MVRNLKILLKIQVQVFRDIGLFEVGEEKFNFILSRKTFKYI